MQLQAHGSMRGNSPGSSNPLWALSPSAVAAVRPMNRELDRRREQVGSRFSPASLFPSFLAFPKIRPPQRCGMAVRPGKGERSVLVGGVDVVTSSSLLHRWSHRRGGLSELTRRHSTDSGELGTTRSENSPSAEAKTSPSCSSRIVLSCYASDRPGYIGGIIWAVGRSIARNRRKRIVIVVITAIPPPVLPAFVPFLPLRPFVHSRPLQLQPFCIRP